MESPSDEPAKRQGRILNISPCPCFHKPPGIACPGISEQLAPSPSLGIPRDTMKRPLLSSIPTYSPHQHFTSNSDKSQTSALTYTPCISPPKSTVPKRRLSYESPSAQCHPLPIRPYVQFRSLSSPPFRRSLTPYPSHPSVMPLLGMVMLLLQEKVLVRAIRRKRHCRSAQSRQRPSEAVEPREVALVAPCLTGIRLSGGVS